MRPAILEIDLNRLTRIRCARPFLVAFALLLASPALAQSSLEVTVFDVSGTPAAGASVTLANEAIGFTATATVNEQGKARFLALGTAGLRGFRQIRRRWRRGFFGRDLAAQQHHDAGLQLILRPPGSFEEQIAVDAGQPFLNTVNAEVAATLTAAEIDVLPVEGRDLTRALYRLPNVTQATGFFRRRRTSASTAPIRSSPATWSTASTTTKTSSAARNSRCRPASCRT